MKSKRSKKYDIEFKRSAIKLIKEQGLSLLQASEGVHLLKNMKYTPCMLNPRER